MATMAANNMAAKMLNTVMMVDTVREEAGVIVEAEETVVGEAEETAVHNQLSDTNPTPYFNLTFFASS